jgi:hypothetical protein
MDWMPALSSALLLPNFAFSDSELISRNGLLCGFDSGAQAR